MASMPGMGDGASSPPSWSPLAAAASWRYRGPAVPAAEASILTRVYEATEKGHAMQIASCRTAPTAAQSAAASSLVATTSSAIARFKDQSVARAEGYFPVTSTAYPVVHWIKPGNFQDAYVLDPTHIQSLVYATTPTGPVLVAGMYLMPRPGMEGPTPGGCLTQWHAHTNLCSHGGVIDGFAKDGRCPDGRRTRPTAVMLHVWQTPVPGGPLAMDPSDLQIVESALMAQQAGTAGPA
jgi:hypothetical protein